MLFTSIGEDLAEDFIKGMDLNTAMTLVLKLVSSF